MSVSAAVDVVTWAALLLLYLGMARLWVEVRSIRRAIQFPLALAGEQTSQHSAFLPAAVNQPTPTIVAVVDSDCSSCWDVAFLMDQLVPAGRGYLLSYESASTWAVRGVRTEAIVDEDAWTSFVPLSTPILVLTNGEQINRIHPPVDTEDARKTLLQWTGKQSEKVG